MIAKPSRDTGLSLLQNNPARELMLEKMRSKLATTPPAALVAAEHKKDVRQKATKTWTVRAIGLIALVAVNYLVIGNRDIIQAKIGKRAVPVLPAPSENLSTDEQALYYVYALYDYPRLKETYGIQAFLAVDANEARKQLDELLPSVSPQTLGLISRYMPVAFKQGPIGRPD